MLSKAVTPFKVKPDIANAYKFDLYAITPNQPSSKLKMMEIKRRKRTLTANQLEGNSDVTN